MSETALDRAHRAMEAAPEDEAARLGFYEALADAELFLLLEGEAEGEDVVPQGIEVEGESFVLAFDMEERLADFAGQAASYAAVSGRALAAMLAEAGAGLGLNLDVAPSAILLPGEAMAWLADLLAPAPEEAEAALREVFAPRLGDEVIAALEAKLAGAGGHADGAILVGAQFDDGARGHMLVILGATPGAEAALARAVSEAVMFAGSDEGVDVSFAQPDSPLARRCALVGRVVDLAMPEVDEVQVPGAAPGMDPSRPPRLK